MRRLPVLREAARGAYQELTRLSNSKGVTGKIARGAQDVAVALKEGVGSLSWPTRPQALNFEITAICDARCIHCPREDMERSQRTMEMSLFKKMVDQAAEMKIPDLCPNGFGELLTMRNLDEHLAYMRSKEHEFRILINTNGFRMTDDKIDSFLNHRVDLLNITLDGATAETFEAIRLKLKLGQIEDNIRRLVAERAKRGQIYPKVRVGMIVMPQNQHEMQMLRDKWEGVVDYVGFGGFTNRGGSLDEATFSTGGEPGPAVSACMLPFKEMNIWADGKAALCCDDWNEEEVVGDLTTQSLQEIWHGEKLHRIRELHMAKRGAEIGICGRCNMWRAAPTGARLWS